MKKKKILKKSINGLSGRPKLGLPKYTSGVLNDSNRYSHATRPKNIGNLSELFPQFLEESDDTSLEAWKKWYTKKYPDTIKEATDRTFDKFQQMAKAFSKIDRDLVENYIEDLVINKTYYGLYYQKIILAYLAKLEGVTYRLASSEEEAKGIDGYVGDTPYSVKSVSYKTMDRLSEEIPAKIVYYIKTDDGIEIEIEE